MRAIATVFILSIAVLLSSCSSGDSRNEKAAALGEKDALEFVSLANNKSVPEIKTQDFLLLVRSKERSLKEAGYDCAAEEYIKSFKTTLEANDSTLYQLIFQ